MLRLYFFCQANQFEKYKETGEKVLHNFQKKLYNSHIQYDCIDRL